MVFSIIGCESDSWNPWSTFGTYSGPTISRNVRTIVLFSIVDDDIYILVKLVVKLEEIYLTVTRLSLFLYESDLFKES